MTRLRLTRAVAIAAAFGVLPLIASCADEQAPTPLEPAASVAGYQRLLIMQPVLSAETASGEASPVEVVWLRPVMKSEPLHLPRN
jgi:hypothetical protein